MKKLKFYHVGGTILLCSLIIGVWAYLIKLIKVEAIKTIAEWLKSILLTIIGNFKNINSFLDHYSSDLKSTNELEPKPSKAGDFKTFVFFSILTINRFYCKKSKISYKLLILKSIRS